MKNQFLTIIFTILFFLAFSVGNAQDKRPTGLIFDDSNYQEMPHLPRYDGVKYQSLPIRVNLKKYAPSVGDQGSIGSCVGWATSYAFTITKAIANDVTDRKMIDDHFHSPSFIYNQIKVNEDCWGGSRITDAMKLMEQKGNCMERTFPYNASTCEEKPGDKAFEEAQHFKIKDFAALFKYDEEQKVKIDKTLKALASKVPVVIGINITDSFWKIESGQKVWNPGLKEEYIAGHAMTVVGYNLADSTFELINSYGSNWGNDGYIKINFENFGRLVRYGFQMEIDDNFPFHPLDIDDNEWDEEIVMNGDFIFRSLVGSREKEDGEFEFFWKPATVTYNSTREVYELEQGKWKVNDIFQLVAKNVPRGDYVYAFSINPQNKLEVHWPLSEEMALALERVKLVSNMVPHNESEIVIPGLEDGLRVEEIGEDFLCVLYSDYEILDFKNRIRKVNSTTGNIHERLATGFEDLLTPSESITYEKNVMRFTSTTSKRKGTVVPIVLSVIAEK